MSEKSKFEVTVEPCPFCGSKAVLTSKNGDPGYNPSTRTIGCENKECRFKPSYSLPTERWESSTRGTIYNLNVDAELIAAWNSRSCL